MRRWLRCVVAGCVFVAILDVITAAVISTERIWQIATCPATSVFDSMTLECRTCLQASSTAANRIPSTVPVDVYGNNVDCRCPLGYLASPGSCTSGLGLCSAPSCIACPVNTFATRDGKTCLPCDGTTAVNNATVKDCSCVNSLHVLVEASSSGSTLTAKTCIPCPTRTRVFPDNDRYTCASCPDPRMTMSSSGSCVCDADYTAVGRIGLGSTSCVTTTVAAQYTTGSGAKYPETSAEKLVYFNFEQPASSSSEAVTSTQHPFTSLSFAHMYTAAAIRCVQYSSEADASACAVLGHLCALVEYDLKSPVCQFFTEIVQARSNERHGWRSWPDAMPFLFYQETGSFVLQSTDISTRFSFNAASETGTEDTLNLILARYALNGTFLGFEKLGRQFDFCGLVAGQSVGTPKWLKYGYSYSYDFSCDLAALVQSPTASANGPEFSELYGLDLYDMYLVIGEVANVNPATGLPMNVYPCPVRVTHLRASDGSFPNMDATSGNDVLTRRFYLYDLVSGVTTSGDSAPATIRYASSIKLTVEAQDEPSLIYPPVLTITYAERDIKQFNAKPDYGQPTIRVKIEYVRSNEKFSRAMLGLFVVAIILVVAVAGMKMFIWHRRNTLTFEESAITCGVLGKFLLYLVGTFSRVFFWYLAILSWYWLVFYKLQSKVFVLLPPDDDLIFTAFKAMIYVCWVCQLVRICEIIHRQTSVDMYFIDWEKSRGMLTSGYRPTEAKAEAGQAHPTANSGPRGDFAPVSVWRTVFAANEWSEMQVYRRSNFFFTILLLLVLLVGADLQYLATPQPSATTLDQNTVNPVLRFANLVWWWLVIFVPQRLYAWLLGERYVGESPTMRFVDLCSVEKVSMLLLPDRYHGYYLHCDAAYEFADGPIETLVQHLSDEEGRMRVGRGLKGSPVSDCQVFEVFVPQIFRQRYDKVFRKLESEERQLAVPQSSLLPYSKQSIAQTKRNVPIQRLVAAASEISGFLKGFIAETEPSLKRVWRQKQYLQRFFNIPPDMGLEQTVTASSLGAAANAVANVVMYADESNCFEELLFRGVEIDLMLFEILTWSVIDLFDGRPLVSALVTFFVFHVVVFVRVWLALVKQVDVAKKDRFHMERFDLQATFPVHAWTSSQWLAHLSKLAEEFHATPDLYGDGMSLNALESDVAALLGKANSMFCVSGVMAQLIAARVHGENSGGKQSVVVHPSSHLLQAEHDAFRHVMNLTCIEIGSVHRSLTLSDFQAADAAGKFTDDVFCVFLELGQRFNGGDVPEWEDLKAISDFCKGKGWKLHMDGARLWEATPYYAQSAGVAISDIAALFDTVYVSWYKGMGALSGATLSGPAEFMAQARVWLRRMGGNLFTVMPLEVAARAALRDVWPTFPTRYDKLVRVVTTIRRDVSEAPSVPAFVRFDPPIPKSCLVHVYLAMDVETALARFAEVEAATGITILKRVREVPPFKGGTLPPSVYDLLTVAGKTPDGTPMVCYSEWNMGVSNCQVPDDKFVAGWRAFIELCRTKQ